MENNTDMVLYSSTTVPCDAPDSGEGPGSFLSVFFLAAPFVTEDDVHRFLVYATPPGPSLFLSAFEHQIKSCKDPRHT